MLKAPRGAFCYDHPMKLILIDNGSIHIRSLKNLCARYGQVSVRPLKDLPSVTDEPNTILILSGSHLASVVGHKKLYKDELDMIRRTEMPIIGVCLGFELIAVAYGMELVRRKRRLHRVTRVYIDSANPLVNGLSSFLTYQSHRWYLDAAHNPLIEVARTRREVEVLRHLTKPIYGMQFHPEVRLNRNSGHLVFESIIEKLISRVAQS